MTCEGVRWETDRALADVLHRELFVRIGELGEMAEAERFKKTVRRTLYRVRLSDGRTVLLKVFRAKSRWDRLVRAVLPSRARHEWMASRRLATMGIPASRAVAIGRPASWGWAVMAYLAIDLEPDVLSLGEHLRGLDDTAEQQGVIGEVARFVRRVHDAGVRQDDLHTGNILVRQAAAADGERLVLIDLQRVHFGGPPAPRHRARAIAQLLNGLDIGVPRGEVVDLFLAVYHGEEPLFANPYLTPGHIECEMDRLAAIRLRSRAKRCLVNSSRFAVETVGGVRLYHRRDWPAADLLALVDELCATVAAEAAETGGPATLRAAVERQEGAAALELIWYPAAGPLARLLPRPLASPGVQRYAEAHRRRVAEGTGPQPIAGIVWLRGARRGSSLAVLTAPRGRRGESA